MRAAEVLVVGGGPAGAACATVLARAGRRVVLVERSAGAHDKVCGEFLGGDALALLAALGVDADALGAVGVERACVARGGVAGSFALPFPARGLSRRVLDEALLGVAAGAGVAVLRGVAASGAVREGEEWAVRLGGGGVLLAAELVVATGKRDLRGHGRAGGAGWTGARLSLGMAAPAGEVLLLPFAGGYAGLLAGGGGRANLCAAIAPGAAGLLRGEGGLVARVRAGSALGAALLAGVAAEGAVAVGGVPYGFVHRARAEAGPWRVGDQFAVIPSFLGDGVAMALAGGMAAAGAMLAGEGAARFHARWRRRVGPAMLLARAAGAVLRHMPGGFAGAVAAWPGLARAVARGTRGGGTRGGGTRGGGTRGGGVTGP